MIDKAGALALIQSWRPDGDGWAEKSRELILRMLDQTEAPFSRHQFTPGHITATAAVLHLREEKFLLIHHRRLDRWLLPGGHVEEDDASLETAAAREALEETGVSVNGGLGLAGMDVHGIPPKRGEPYHLHHDLIFSFRAKNVDTAASEESRAVQWASVDEFDRYDVPEPIRRALRRVAGRRVSR